MTKYRYIEDYKSLGFGLFIHYGLYSLLGKGEWSRAHWHIPKEEYESLAGKFTAENLDTDEWAALAKRAGMRYIVLTTRHHEGFSLYDTCGLNTFDSVHSPCGRDIVREFVDSCRKYDLLPVLYHTTLDWHNPDFFDDFPAYLRYLRESVKILCTKYGKIGGFWFDGNWSLPDGDWEEDALYGLIRSYQPEAVIVNNTGLSARGETGHPEIDCVTYERGRPQTVPAGRTKPLAGEMCQTVNSHWGIATRDINYRPMADILDDLLVCRRSGCNFLLNLAPAADGAFRGMERGYFDALSVWYDVYGEVVRNAVYTPEPAYEGHYLIRGRDCAYLAVKGLAVNGDGNVVLADRAGKDVSFTADLGIKKIEWLDTGEPLTFAQNGNAVELHADNFPYGSDLGIRIARISY